MVAEDRQGVGGHGAGGDVHREGGQLAGDLVHVGDHQEEALRRREGRRERPGLQGPVDRPGRAALGLHLDHVGHDAPDVLAALRRPLVAELAHVRRGGDRVDRDHFAQAVGDRGRRFVPVHRDHVPAGHWTSPSTRLPTVLSTRFLHDAGQAGTAGIAVLRAPGPATFAGGGCFG